MRTSVTILTTLFLMAPAFSQMQDNTAALGMQRQLESGPAGTALRNAGADRRLHRTTDN